MRRKDREFQNWLIDVQQVAYLLNVDWLTALAICQAMLRK